MIEALWAQFQDLWEYLVTNFDPVRDTIDFMIVTFGIYWLLLLIRGTRAVQILLGLIVLFGLWLAADFFQLATLGLIFENFLPSAVLIVIILFQHDIRRALARMGGVFPSVAAQQASQMLEEVVRAAQTLAQKRVGALIVLERETRLADQMETGVALDSAVSKEILTSIFLPYSPLHDGAVVVQQGRIAFAGCILPLTLRDDLPEGVGTRHRAAVGITEETDAVVVVVSEENATISVVVRGDMLRGLDAPRLRVALRDLLSGESQDLSRLKESAKQGEATPADASPDEGMRSAG